MTLAGFSQRGSHIYIYIYIYTHTDTQSPATLLFNCLVTQIDNHSITWQQINAFSGEDDLLKFKPSIRMGNKGDLSDFGCGMVVGARRAGLSI